MSYIADDNCQVIMQTHFRTTIHIPFCLIITIMIYGLLLSSSPCNGQSAEKSQRPAIGLALSGGGSHGIAHLGVLKVMEESGLRPDYITGVSMGSIVGGLYSIGYPVDSLIDIIKSLDWNLLLGNRIPENKIIFQEKPHFYNSLITLSLSRDRVNLPSGLSNGQQIENMLGYYSWPAADINDFSKFPIPYMAIGSDLLSGSMIELKKGYLPDAMRASSAVPSIFTPYRIDTLLLVDGGLLRNIAIPEVKNMGADIIIASYTGFLLYGEEELESVASILKQVGFLMSFKDFMKTKEMADILIIPDVRGISSTVFSNPDTLIQRGYNAALKYKERFRIIADSLDAIYGKQVPRASLLDKQVYRFDRIDITGNHLTTRKQIAGVLDIAPGDTVDKNKVNEGIELLYGKAWFEKIGYRILSKDDSLILQVNCKERPRAMIYGSLHYDNALSSGVLLSFTGRDLLTPRSVINIDSYIGEYYRLKVSLMQFVDASQKFGVEAALFMDNTRLPLVTVRGETGAMFSRNVTAGLFVNKRISLNHMMKAGAEFENLNLITDYLPASRIKRLGYDYITLIYDYEANTLDSKNFPDEGVEYSLSASTSGLFSGVLRTDSTRIVYTDSDTSGFSFNRFYTGRAWFRSYFSPSSRVTLKINGEALFITTVDSIAAQNNFYTLGGIEPITNRSIPALGFHPGQIPVKSVAGIGMSVDVEIMKDLHLTGGCNFFGIQEPSDKTYFYFLGGYGLGVGYMTIAGPIQVGIMHGIYSRELLFSPVKGYVSVGFTF